MTLFSNAMVELAKLSGGRTAEEVEADFNWFMGNNGTVSGLRAGKLVTVTAGSVNTNPTEAEIRHAIQGAFLNSFCTCLSDDEAVENYKEAKLWFPGMRNLATDRGVDTTTPIVRLIDPTRHLLFNMKIGARHCGPCVEGFDYMRGWGYNGRMTECDGRNKLLVFGAQAIVTGSTNYTMSEQKDLLNDMSKKMCLPHHLIYGSVALDALVALSHLHETGGEVSGHRLPANNLFAWTDTKSCGFRLGLWWGGDGRLCCDSWCWCSGAFRCDALGCFALGVVKL